ncbi:Glucan endo-1,3-beta-glucosidase 11 [Apostasia shenzhenica]|uniref:glucan endo-1,3-beta-D-glucosidase n=1 Tax=Apostasia shenzhenica TaxID=1088818 RepID=A0A2I0BDA7_9ASPA|nr:Glucan endo-1,3-beta-glucosidase 11 [Apostasia shenzhenica]
MQPSAPSILLLLALSWFPPAACASAAAFSPTIGINYGQVANNLPSPEAVIPLLRSVGAGHVKLFDTNPRILRPFAGTTFDFVVGLPDDLIPKVRDPAAALSWIKSNIQPYLPRTKITAVTVGNEVLTGNNTKFIQNLLPAIQSLHSALASLGLDRQVAVTTAHSLNVLSASFPPSAGAFRRDLLPFVSSLINFLNKSGSPFLINAYPFFAYRGDPQRVSLDYAVFRQNAGVVDPATGLRYSNMLHAQVDAVLTAIAAAGGGKTVDVRVSETGWPSAGDDDEVGASPQNARTYNGNLMKMVAEGKGTPMRPGSPLQVYVFALFNENMKPGPASERHYGLFKPDGTPAYDIGVALPAINTSSGGVSGVGTGGSEGGEGFPDQSADDTYTNSYFTFSSALGGRSALAPEGTRRAAAVAGVAAAAAGFLCKFVT